MMCKYSCSQHCFILLTCFQISGCTTVGPDYKNPPELTLPQTWNQDIAQHQHAVDLSTWWIQFNDPVLNSLMMHAELQNLDLRLAIARILETEQQYTISSSFNYPSLNAAAGYSREQLSENQRGIPTQANNLRSLSLNLSWELDLFGRIQREKEAAAYTIDASIENYRDVLVLLNAEVARIYVEIKVLQERLIVAHKNVDNQNDTLKIVKARYQADLVSEIDLTRAKQNLAQTQSLIPLLEASQIQQLNRLAVLTGQLPGSLDKIILTSMPMPQIHSGIITSIPKDVVRQRPDIRRAERNLAAQTARIGIATADLYPRFSLSGLFGFATVSDSLLSHQSEFWSLGPDTSWDLFNAGRKRSQIKVEEIRLEQAKTQYEQIVLTALEEVENSLSDYAKVQKRLTYLTTSSNAARKTVKLAKERYRLGLTSFQEVLDAERVLFSEEDSFVVNQGNLVLEFINIYRAMGGGWDSSQVVLHQDK